MMALIAEVGLPTVAGTTVGVIIYIVSRYPSKRMTRIETKVKGAGESLISLGKELNGKSPSGLESGVWAKVGKEQDVVQ